MSTSNLRCDLAAVLLFAGCLLSYVDAAAQNGTYNFVNIDYPGAAFSAPNGVNDSGQIVGYWQDASGTFTGTSTTMACIHRSIILGGQHRSGRY